MRSCQQIIFGFNSPSKAYLPAGAGGGQLHTNTLTHTYTHTHSPTHTHTLTHTHIARVAACKTKSCSNTRFSERFVLTVYESCLIQQERSENQKLRHRFLHLFSVPWPCPLRWTPHQANTFTTVTLKLQQTYFNPVISRKTKKKEFPNFYIRNSRCCANKENNIS